MIELERHIEILLLRHDCVILPGFGGFMTHHVEARYDEAERLFLPPLRTIGFNPGLKMNDSLLVQSYIEVYDISYPEALRRIEDEVDELKQRLANEGSFELRNIGTLSVGEDGIYLFEPCEAGILTPCLYGLSSYEMPLLSDTQQTANQATNTITSTDKEGNDEPALAAMTGANSILGIENDEEDNRFIRLRVSVVRNIAAACIALIAFFAASTPLNNSSQMMTQGKIDTSILDKLLAGETSMKRSTAMKQSTQVTKPALQEVNTEAKTIKQNYYCIVLASKVTKSNATSFVSKLHEQGFKNARLLMGHGAIKVVYGNYPSEEEAYSQLKSLSGNDTFKEGWIFRVIEK